VKADETKLAELSDNIIEAGCVNDRHPLRRKLS
jgi:hypothetical protein